MARNEEASVQVWVHLDRDKKLIKKQNQNVSNKNLKHATKEEKNMRK